MKNVNEIFGKDVTYDNIESHKKPSLHPLSRGYIFGKITGRGQIDHPRLFMVTGEIPTCSPLLVARCHIPRNRLIHNAH